MTTGSEVVIVGGGVIGLSIAYALACEGTRATVLDQGPLGKAASWAGAGILTPISSRVDLEPAAALRALSARLHAEWASRLLEETGIDNGYRRCGSIDVAFDADEANDLDAMAPLWRDEGVDFERLDAAAIAHHEPVLSRDVRLAYRITDRAQIRNPRHVRALIAACERRGVVLLPGEAAVGFERDETRIRAVRTRSGPLPCDRVVLAAGAWSEVLLGALDARLATAPVRGQIVLLRTDRPVLRHIIEHGRRYLVPRDDGRILVGSTEEDAGFDARTTARGVLGLIAAAVELCPTLASAEVERSWAGLRPGSADSRPTLGPISGFENAWVATGHRRAGLQLSTGSAAVMTDLIQGRAPAFSLAPFRFDRPPSTPTADPFRS